MRFCCDSGKGGVLRKWGGAEYLRRGGQETRVAGDREIAADACAGRKCDAGGGDDCSDPGDGFSSSAGDIGLNGGGDGTGGKRRGDFSCERSGDRDGDFKDKSDSGGSGADP